MHPSLMLLDHLVQEHQETIAIEAEFNRQVKEAIIEDTHHPVRSLVGRTLITLGERVGGIHQDAIEALADKQAAAQALPRPARRAA